MAQNGFHGLFGLVVGPSLARRLGMEASARQPFMLGFVLGNMLPDADWVPVLMVYPVDPDLAVTMHRGFTHSLAAAALPAVGFGAAAWLARDRTLRAWGWGLTLGMLAHILLDLCFWFSGVDLLWPLPYFGLAERVNLWKGFYVPPVLGRLLAACDYLAYAIYYAYLEYMARETERGLRYIPVLGRLRGAMGWLTALYLLLALLLDELPFNLLQWTVWSLVAFPTALYMTAKMSPALDAAARRR